MERFARVLAESGISGAVAYRILASASEWVRAATKEAVDESFAGAQRAIAAALDKVFGAPKGDKS